MLWFHFAALGQLGWGCPCGAKKVKLYQYGDTAMSRYLARSALADASGRLFNLLLFVLLLPAVLILSRREGIDNPVPDDPGPRSGRQVPKAA